MDGDLRPSIPLIPAGSSSLIAGAFVALGTKVTARFDVRAAGASPPSLHSGQAPALGFMFAFYSLSKANRPPAGRRECLRPCSRS